MIPAFRIPTALIALAAATLSAAEPTVAFNGWTNIPGIKEGTVTLRPIDTTTPAPPYGYCEYLPLGYRVVDPDTGETSVDTSKRWPVVICLLGTGEAGDGKSTQSNMFSKLTKHGPLYQVEAKKWDFPAIVVQPQPFSGSLWSSPNTLKLFVNYMKANYQADPDRIYMTGLCEGGGGTWRYAHSYPETLAAIMPIQSNQSPWTGTDYAKYVGLPIWAFHTFIDRPYPRRGSINWLDPIARLAYPGFTSNVMAAYPGYGDTNTQRMNHYKIVPGVDGLPSAYKQLASYTATLNPGSSTVTFSSTITMSYATDWISSTAKPFARLRVRDHVDAYVIQGVVPQNGACGGVILNAPYSGPAAVTTTVYVDIPQNGVNTTGDIIFGTGGSPTGWSFADGIVRNDASKLRVTLYWYSSHGDGWVETWNTGSTWDWLFSQVRVLSNG